MMINVLSWLAHFISALGAMNWGTVVFFNINLVDQAMVRCNAYQYRRIAYACVAVAGLYSMLALFIP